jgi:hypothetical protein
MTGTGPGYPLQQKTVVISVHDGFLFRSYPLRSAQGLRPAKPDPAHDAAFVTG